MRRKCGSRVLSRSLTRTWRLALLLSLLLIHPSGGSAQNTALSPDRDGGGTSGSESCSVDQVLVGVQSVAYLFLSQITGLCRGVDAQGRWVGTETQKLHPFVPTLSHPLTQLRTIRCPANHAVSRFHVLSGNVVHNVDVHCKPLTANGTVSGTEVRAGGTTPIPNQIYYNPQPVATELPCPNSRAARGMHWMYGMFYDRIGLRCGLPQFPRAITLTRTTVPPGQPLVGTVTLNAGNGGTIPMAVSVRSSVNGVTLSPSTPMVMPGGNSAVFTITTPQVSAPTVVTLTATMPNGNGAAATAGFIIQP